MKKVSFYAYTSYLLFILTTLVGCSENDSAEDGACFQDEGREIVEKVTDIPGVISFECVENYIIDPDIRLSNNPIGILFPCNLEKEFQVDGLQVVFSGYIYESFEFEDICADFFEITDIQLAASDLVGTWQLAYYETAEGRVDPPNDNKPVYFDLKTDGTFDGMAGNNFLEAGQYSTADGQLNFTFGVTEIAGTAWEKMFYDSIVQTWNGEAFVMPYSLENNELVLFYTNDDTMHFVQVP